MLVRINLSKYLILNLVSQDLLFISFASCMSPSLTEPIPRHLVIDRLKIENFAHYIIKITKNT
jgi:predicted neutral ceramidase superfamily lipid hydrolase